MSKRMFLLTDMAFFRCKGCRRSYRAYRAIQDGLPVMRDEPRCPHCGEEITVLHEIPAPKDLTKMIDKRPEQLVSQYPLLAN